MMSYLYCGGTESLKTNVPDLLEVRIANVHKIKWSHLICWQWRQQYSKIIRNRLKKKIVHSTHTKNKSIFLLSHASPRASIQYFFPQYTIHIETSFIFQWSAANTEFLFSFLMGFEEMFSLWWRRSPVEQTKGNIRQLQPITKVYCSVKPHACTAKLFTIVY